MTHSESPPTEGATGERETTAFADGAERCNTRLSVRDSVIDRRSLLLAGAGGLATLAGCLGGDSDGDDDPDNDSQDQTPGGGEDGSDNGGENGSENGGENGGDNGADNGSENGVDNGSENGGDNGSDTGGENGGEDGDENSSENGTAVSFSDPRVGEPETEPTLLSGRVKSASVTLTNTQSEFVAPTLSLTVVPTDSETPVAVYEQDVLLRAGESERFSFSGVTSDLDPGSYEFTFSAKESATAIPLEIAARDDDEVTITVYGKRIAKGNEVDSALLIITDGDTEVTTTDVTGDGSVTVSLPLGDTRTYTAELTTVNQSSLPDTTTEFTVEEDSPTVNVVAGYPFNGKYTHRFIHYRYLPQSKTDDGKRATELLGYGEYARESRDYHIRYLTGQVRTQEPIPPQGELPLDYGDDLTPLGEQRNLGVPRHVVQVGFNGKSFFHTEVRNQWERTERAYGYMTNTIGAATALDETFEDGEREFVGTDTVQGTTVDVFLINDGYAREYVDPETGYTRRRETLYNDMRDTYEIVEFFGYEENLETLDWEFIKARTSDTTAPDTDMLPWNAETED